MSPIFGHFGETVHGLLTLRAFRGQERFVAHNRALVNSSNRAYWGIQEVIQCSIQSGIYNKQTVLGCIKA